MLSYYRLDTMKQSKPEYCVLRDFPQGLGLLTYKLGNGVKLEAGEYPADARIFMSDQEPGIELPDSIGNTCSMLVLSKHALAVFETVDPGPVQLLPVSIYNHKKRLASGDYTIVNPLGTRDVLDTARSEIEMLSGKVVRVNKYVLDPKKLEGAPDLFRIRESSEEYVISERVLSFWRAQVPKPTNLGIFKLEVAGA